MTINKFNLQFFSEEAFVEEEAPTEDVVEEVEDTPVEDSEATETEKTEEPDYTEANKAFLERFKIQFDGKDKTYESIEQLMEDAQMGGALPRYKDKVSKYEEKLNSPHYKWVDDYMKSSGFDSGEDFVKAIQVNDKKSSLMDKGMSEEDAQAEAEDYVNKTFGTKTDKKTQEIDKFLTWHQSKVEGGKFKESIDPDNIPKQVIEAFEQGESLTEAYMDYMLDDITVKTEQETLKKLQKNKETSTGGLKPNASKETTMSAEQVVKTMESMSRSERQAWIKANDKLIEKSGYYDLI